MKNKCIVIASEHHNGLGVIRSLGERGIKPIVILVSNPKRSFVSKSKYIEKVFFSDTEHDIIKILLDLPVEEKKPVVIACYDNVSSVIDQNRDLLIERISKQCPNLLLIAN